MKIALPRSQNVVRPIFQFIIANEPICGDPFIDPQWLPALEDCQIDCDISAQICQERTDKGFPGQRCINLPLGCKDRIKKMLNLDPNIPAMQLPLAPLTTLPPSPFFKQETEMDINDDGKMPGIEPQMPIAYIDNAVTYPTTKTIPLDYEDERNINTDAKMPFNWEERVTESTNKRKDFEFQGTPSNQNYEDYDTTSPSSYRMSMMGSQMSRSNIPWSWKDLEHKLKSRPFYSVDQSGTIEDLTPNCCQWALDGLCDRSWQRVRQLCQKSCGTVICTSKNCVKISN
uniref:ShKT domain-containing protein n=1 Tax=Panagrolaimus sp. PS1159 TaxID=55785 RepID=A0AC35GIK6_9BILA